MPVSTPGAMSAGEVKVGASSQSRSAPACGLLMPPDNRHACRSKLRAKDSRELALLGGKSLVRGDTGFFFVWTRGQKEAPDAGDEPGLRVPFGGNHVMRGNSITLHI